VPQGQRRIADLVARVPLQPSPAPLPNPNLFVPRDAILLHLETQAQPDPTLPERLRIYNTALENREGLPALSVAFLPFGAGGAGGAGPRRAARLVQYGLGLDRRYARLDYWLIGLRDLDAWRFARSRRPVGVALAALMQPGSAGRVALKLAIVRKLGASVLDDARGALLVNCVETSGSVKSQTGGGWSPAGTVRVSNRPYHQKETIPHAGYAGAVLFRRPQRAGARPVVHGCARAHLASGLRVASRPTQATRTTRRPALLADLLCRPMSPSPFPRIAQVARLLRTVRTVRTAKKTTTETVYLITSLTPRQADPARLLALIRGHGSVESRHWLRAVTVAEDRSRLRSGPAPQIMAAFRTLALTLIRRTGTTAIAAFRQHLPSRPTKALRLLVPKTHVA